jgi:hypothetical protein
MPIPQPATSRRPAFSASGMARAVPLSLGLTGPRAAPLSPWPTSLCAARLLRHRKMPPRPHIRCRPVPPPSAPAGRGSTPHTCHRRSRPLEPRAPGRPQACSGRSSWPLVAAYEPIEVPALVLRVSATGCPRPWILRFTAGLGGDSFRSDGRGSFVPLPVAILP